MTDRMTLAALDREAGYVACVDCPEPAAPAVFAGHCRHCREVVILACRRHRDETMRHDTLVCGSCRRHGRPRSVLVWQSIFERRSRA